MLTSDFGVYYLNFNTNTGDFELLHENTDFFQSPVLFTAAQVNYKSPTPSDLLIFRDDENHMFATLTYQNGQFVSKLERIPAHIISPKNKLIAFPVKKKRESENSSTSQNFLKATTNDSSENQKYQLTFVDQEQFSSSTYQLDISDQPN